MEVAVRNHLLSLPVGRCFLAGRRKAQKRALSAALGPNINLPPSPMGSLYRIRMPSQLGDTVQNAQPKAPAGQIDSKITVPVVQGMIAH